MPRYNLGGGQATKPRHRRVPRRIWLVIASVVVVVIVGVVVTRHIYDGGLGPVNSSQQTQIFTVEKGSTVNEIATSLEKANLVKSAWAFKLYVQRTQQGDKLQAGTYAISPNQGTKSIVSVLTKGAVATDLVTILPGRRIDQVRADLINDGFTPGAVDAALKPDQYADLPVLSYKPDTVTTLEGLLWPESYQRQPDTDPAVIIRESLKTMGDKLTPNIQAAFAAQGLSVYQGLTLTSIVVQEVNKPADQAQAAQVFLSRLKNDSVLGSDVTAFYGSVAAGRAPDLRYDSPYNTLQRKGLPPTPISTVTADGLYATTHPANTDWLFFVAGDDGTTYFSHTNAEHEALTKKYCTKLCGN